MASGDDSPCSCQPPRIASTRRCSPEDPHISIRKLVELIADPISSESFDRHLLILNDFLDACTHAYWVKDLPFVMRLFELLIDRLEEVCLYRKPLESLLSLCAVPPMLTRSSEAVTYSRDVQEYFSFLGYLLIRLQKPELQDLILHALCELLQRKAPMETCCVKLETCYEAVEASRLPSVISQLLEIANDDLYLKLLKLTLILVNISPTVCLKMISERAIDSLMVRLEPCWSTRIAHIAPPDPEEDSIVPNYEITIKVLWALLNAFKTTKKEIKMNVAGPNIQALWSFRYALRAFTKKKNNEINRNHFIGILLLCLDSFPDLEVIASGLSQDIAILSAATELGTEGTWASHVCFSTSDADYDFKKMMLLALCYCAARPKIGLIVHPKRVLPALLRLITPELSITWHPQQYKKLISFALHALQALVPQLSDEFLQYNGPLRLLMMIECFILEPYDLQTLKDCLKSLDFLASIGNEDILDNLRIQDASCILISICDNLLSNEVLTILCQQCLAYGFSILEYLFQEQQGCSASSVNLCFKFMHRVVNPNTDDPVLNPNFLICAIDFLWESVVWCENNLRIFVSKGGTFILLDIIQISIFPVKLVALGALVDMCDEGSCVPHLVTWRKRGQTLLPMLLQLFREENLQLGVKVTSSGAVSDMEMPIMGQQQWYETFHENKNPNSSPATVDLLGSCRPKIYALIQLLNNRHELRVAIANERYHLYNNNNLSTLDQMTLLLAENFLALKLGEAWIELGRDIEVSGIQPLLVDGDVLALLKRRFYKWAQHIQIVQQKLLDREMKNDCKDEKHLYNTLRDSKLIESLKALHELDYIARTTERMFRLIAKMKHTKDLDNSLNFTPGADHHTTYMRQPKVTPVFLQTVNIQSNTIVDPTCEEFDLRPVSPPSDDYTISEKRHDGSDSHIEEVRMSVFYQ